MNDLTTVIQMAQTIETIKLMLGTLTTIVTIAIITWMITKYIEGGE